MEVHDNFLPVELFVLNVIPFQNVINVIQYTRLLKIHPQQLLYFSYVNF